MFKRKYTSAFIMLAFAGITFLSLADFNYLGNIESLKWLLSWFASGNSGNVATGSDKIFHSIFYCGLTLILKLFSRFENAAIALLSIGYGILMEIAQYFTSWRSCDLADVGANSIGTLIAIIPFAICERIKQKNAGSL